ncbi:hypothetical protein EST38_g9865 [Candolleomyces aberdarensis]|uniref:Uncharacterized protein n=1 Tax=Candolleomyces aberdarensis TaxID=2316362 RepID=A0A4Q2D8V1_9AGAR|nr:hypothetical protein EST38_g9865 [Candolleomyces aberdarensis]
MNEDWLDELQENVKIGIYVTLRLLEKERSESKLTWKYLSERLYQAAHLRSREEPCVSSEELWVVKGQAPERGLLREWLQILLEKDNVHEATSKVLLAPGCGLEKIGQDKRRSNQSPGKCLIDVTFLRFPTATCPCFKVALPRNSSRSRVGIWWIVVIDKADCW